MRLLVSTFLAVLISCTLNAQSTYDMKLNAPLAKAGTVDLSQVEHEDVFIQYLEYPKPGGDAYHAFLQEQKAKAEAMFPRRDGPVVETRSAVEPPVLLKDFSGNSWSAGIPLDNHLAFNRQDQIVSVVNTHMLVVKPTGVWEESYNLDEFWAELNDDELYFDPRIIYDPQEDKFILAMMQDYDCSGSNIVFAFSETSDPTGVWHIYQFEGCPNIDGTFADYPMIALTDNELFFTYNAVYQDSSWQTGFAQTLIYQINKRDGYEGKDLRWRSWENIAFEGSKIRYMCPVKAATEDLNSGIYFLSTRSFDIQNDTVFMLHINDDQDHPDLKLTVQPLLADNPYGVPPNAVQPQDRLQTNDARVLDAFIIDDEIQFVANTMDMATGRSAVYHGIVSHADTEPFLRTFILRNESDFFGYPGIAYTGQSADERDAIIVASHSSETRFPGYSVLYYNLEHSEWITVKEGLRIIDMIKPDNPFGADPTLERWGDYSGIQRDFANNGTVWTASSYGKPGNANDTWIGNVARPEEATSTSTPAGAETTSSVFPNPANTIVTVEVNTRAKGSRLQAVLFDLQGKPVSTVYQGDVERDVPFRFHYNTSSLAPGTYIMKLDLDGTTIASEKVVVVQ